MIGPEGGAELVRLWLAPTTVDGLTVPGRLAQRLRMIETRLELISTADGVTGKLPDPARILAQEQGPIPIEDWPSVYVLPQRMTGMTLVDVEPGGREVYRCTYAIRVLAWVRADGYAATDTLRKRYALALRETLLERKALRSSPPSPAVDGVRLDSSVGAIVPESLREDYSDVMTDSSKRTIAGVFLDFGIVVTEVLEPPADEAPGTVITNSDVTATGDTATVPPHPGLD